MMDNIKVERLRELEELSKKIPLTDSQVKELSDLRAEQMGLTNEDDMMLDFDFSKQGALNKVELTADEKAKFSEYGDFFSEQDMLRFKDFSKEGLDFIVNTVKEKVGGSTMEAFENNLMFKGIGKLNLSEDTMFANRSVADIKDNMATRKANSLGKATGIDKKLIDIEDLVYERELDLKYPSRLGDNPVPNDLNELKVERTKVRYEWLEKSSAGNISKLNKVKEMIEDKKYDMNFYKSEEDKKRMENELADLEKLQQKFDPLQNFRDKKKPDDKGTKDDSMQREIGFPDRDYKINTPKKIREYKTDFSDMTKENDFDDFSL